MPKMMNYFVKFYKSDRLTNQLTDQRARILRDKENRVGAPGGIYMSMVSHKKNCRIDVTIGTVGKGGL